MAEGNTSPTKDRWTGEWQAFLGALAFLTRVPLPTAQAGPAPAGALLYFPVVGLVVAIASALVFAIAVTLLPQSVSLALALTSLMLLTGAFHEDGFADSADGLGGGWGAEDKLRIMKDSRVGTYGALALVMLVLIKFVTLSSLPVDAVVTALVLGQVIGRWSALPLIRLTPYVGAETGTAHPLLPGARGPRLIVASALTLLLILLIQPGAAAWLVVWLALVLALWRWHCLRQVGGITGDTLGAANQLAEVTTYLVLVALA